jgi:hypothetical protein
MKQNKSVIKLIGGVKMDKYSLLKEARLTAALLELNAFMSLNPTELEKESVLRKIFLILGVDVNRSSALKETEKSTPGQSGKKEDVGGDKES